MPSRSTPNRSKDKPLPKGLKIQLKGLLTIDQATASFHQAMAELRRKGVKKLRATNIYTNPADEAGSPITGFSGGEKFQDIVIVEPYRSAAEEHGV